MSVGPGRVRRIWVWLRSPSAHLSLLSLLLIGFISGILFWGGFNTAMEATNTLSFCTSCHEMRDTVFVEYKQTIHYSNRSGVRAICSDCHVPRDWVHKVARKIRASGELYGKLTGVIDTPQKFEAKRSELAQRTWKRMKETDSIECRNCHSKEAMSSEKQTEKAKTRHAKGFAEGSTCIDCHFGIAHNEPEGPGPRELFGK
ncbi:MAG: NapC/NirT family cytochrome c [Burkholderiaceae bacterium]|nr:NapC/NirT family cytochrome c [Burkholderiaceae bacterium]